MKKLATLFTDSYHEFGKVRTITLTAMFAAIAIILGYFTLALGDSIKIGFSSISNQLVGYMFGPVVGCVFGGALDILKFMIKPTGPFFPGITINAMLAGLLYGCFFYKRPLCFWRVFMAEGIVLLVCNILLGTWCLQILTGKGFMLLLPPRVLKNLIMWPISSLLFYFSCKMLKPIINSWEEKTQINREKTVRKL